MELRDEVPSDRTAISAIHLAAFGDHGRLVSALIDGLRETIDPTQRTSLVAIVDGAAVGHVMFTRSILDAPDRLLDVQVLSPVGVLPEHQRRGIGRALIGRGLDLLAERGVPLVFLEGDPGYYSRLGFRPGGELGFRRPSLRIPEPAFQVMPLPTYEPWMTGTLVYAHAFWDHDAVGLRDESGHS